MIKIEKSSALDQPTLLRLKQSARDSAAKDFIETFFFWKVSEAREGLNLNEFIFWIDREIAGYLCICTFDDEHVEIRALVRPEYRRQGIFSRLWKEACVELKARLTKKCYLAFNKKFIFSKPVAMALGLTYAYSEHDLLREQPFSVDSRYKQVTVSRVTIENLPIFLGLLASAGEQVNQELIDYFNELLNGGEFRAYLACDKSGYFGSVQGMVSNKKAKLYRFSSVNVPRQKSEFFLKHVVNLFFQENVTEVSAQVSTDLELAFYEELGFSLLDTTEYWVHYFALEMSSFLESVTIH